VPVPDAPSESFLFDPRDFITGPFEACPHCDAPDEFGLLMVTGRGYVKRCRRCMRDSSFDLPALSKRLIYLDQHAISHLAKSIHPDYRDQYAPGDPRTQDGFWPEAFGRLDRLNKLHLAVCPESTLQRQESLLDDRLSGLLRAMYEHLAGEVAFYDHNEIERFELNRAFCAWLDDEPVRALDRDDVTRGIIDRWLDPLRVVARLGLDELEAAEARQWRAQCDEVMEYAFSHWRADDRVSFADYFDVQIAEAAKAKLAGWPFSALSYGFRRRLEERGVPQAEHAARVAAFLESEAFAKVPCVRISAALWAALADEIVSGRASQPSGGMVQDIQAISHFLPYSDAVFVDKQCQRLLCESPAAERLPAPRGQVFSIANRDEFMRFLDQVEQEAPAGQHELVVRVYGESRLEPFTRLYEWREGAEGS
jgi:hypothetical protein